VLNHEKKPDSPLVIIAALNEEPGIGRTMTDLSSHLDDPRYLVVDGRSVDGTAKIAESMGAQVIFQKGKGKGDALATGIMHAQSVETKYAVLIDADFTYPAEHLPEMIEILEQNPKAGMICGNRFNSRTHIEAMNNRFYLGNRLLAFTHNLLNGITLRDPLTGLRVVRWEILKDWTPKSKGFDIEVELNHRVERKGYGIVEIDIKYRPRMGEKKLKLRHGFTILKRILLETTY